MASSPFFLWSTLGNVFTKPSGPSSGLIWSFPHGSANSNPIWIDDETSEAGLAQGGPQTYDIDITAQSYFGSEQATITIASPALIDPFQATTWPQGNEGGSLGQLLYLSESNNVYSAAAVWWQASATVGDYDIEFETFTDSFENVYTSTPAIVPSGQVVTLDTAIANPTNWEVVSTSNGFMLAYQTAPTPTTERVYIQFFNDNGAATTQPDLVYTGADGSIANWFIGKGSSTNGDFFYTVTGAQAGEYVDDVNSSNGTVSGPYDVFPLTNYSTVFAYDGTTNFSNGNALGFTDGMRDGQHVIDVNLFNSSFVSQGIQTTFDLSGTTGEGFSFAELYDPNTGHQDYTALAYVDAGEVHLELLDDNGVQIGSDFVIPGATSLVSIHDLGGSPRIEVAYTVANPAGGDEVVSAIYDTATQGESYTINDGTSGFGEWPGTTFDDTITYGPGTNYVDGGGGVDTFLATNFSSSQVTITIDASGDAVVNDGAGDIDTLIRFTTIDLSDATVTINGNTLTQLDDDGSKTVSTFNIVGEPFASKVIAYNTSGQVVSKLYQGVTGDGYLSSYEYSYAGGGLVGSSDTFTGLSNPDYTTEQTNYNGGGELTSEVFSGGGTSSPYSKIEYNSVGGVFSGAAFTVTAVPQGASYSSYEIDLNAAEAFSGDKFFFTGLTGLGYTDAEEDFDASGKITRAVLTGLTGGQPYYQLEEDYSGGLYEGYKAYYAITGSYTTEEVDVSAANVLERVVYTGATQSVEEDYTGGSLSGVVYGYTDVTGASYNAYQIYENAGGTALSEVFDLDSGVHSQVALVAGQSLTSEGNDKFTGSASGSTTFVLNPVYGQDTITNLTSADSVVMSATEFTNFSRLLGAATTSGANVVVTASDGDTLTLKNISITTLQDMSSVFTFH